MELALHANISDLATRSICNALREPFDSVGAAIRNEYGGIMRHLWIDFE